jgi:hypothetical protein
LLKSGAERIRIDSPEKREARFTRTSRRWRQHPLKASVLKELLQTIFDWASDVSTSTAVRTLVALLAIPGAL